MSSFISVRFWFGILMCCAILLKTASSHHLEHSENWKLGQHGSRNSLDENLVLDEGNLRNFVRDEPSSDSPFHPTAPPTMADIYQKYLADMSDPAATAEDRSRLEVIWETLTSQISNSSSFVQSRSPEIVQSRPRRRTVAEGAPDLTTARALVDAAQREAGASNAYRLANPRLNTYSFNNSQGSSTKARSDPEVPYFSINSTIAEAAAIVAEADAAARASNGTLLRNYTLPAQFSSTFPNVSSFGGGQLSKRTTAFWMETLVHDGIQPFGGDSTYKVFRNVQSYGAVGDGKTDDTAAINKAISDGNRCGSGCGTSSVKGALVYFPAGTYLVSSPIISLYNTQLVGNVNSYPTLRASSSFVGLGVITSDVYVPNGNSDEWYINQSNFLRQVRNFVIDIQDMPSTLEKPCGIHWQVAQGTSLQNIDIYASSASGSNQIGIFAENGSGGFMSDLIFNGDAIGIQCGNQQFTSRGLIFLNTNIAIDMLWDWGWTWKSIIIWNSSMGIRVNGTDIGGSLQIIDSEFAACTLAGIWITLPKGPTTTQSNYVTLDNVKFSGTSIAVLDSDTVSWLSGASDPTISSWIIGKIYDGVDPAGLFISGATIAQPTKPPTLLSSNGYYYERSKPQYGDVDASTFINAHLIAKGDGVTDDTVALTYLLLAGAALGRVVYFPAGSYIVSDTISIPVGSKIVGECWSQLVAKGANFADMSNPRVMLKVGNQGDNGVVEIQDMLFTASGPTPGLVLVEWNIHQSTQGSAAMWDSHFRIGGALGTGQQKAQCPTGSLNIACIGASLMLHLTPPSSAYLENMWIWTADHDMDDTVNSAMINVFTARGILIQSAGPSWLYGTASEHSVLYQYQVSAAQNIFMCMIQTESPYFPPVPAAPTPFQTSLGQFQDDPRFTDCSGVTGCAVSWALRILRSQNIIITSAGLYSWYSNYDESCVDTQNCQQNLVSVTDSGGILIFNLYTIGSVTMISGPLTPALAKPNTNQVAHPYVSTISGWFEASEMTYYSDIKSIGPSSSCIDIEAEVLNSDLWNAVNATQQLEAFVTNTTIFPMGVNKISNFSTVLATPLGNGQSFDCKLPTGCLTPNCNTMQQDADPYTAWKYFVEVSVSNLNQVIAHLYTGITNAQGSFTADSIAKTFYPANDVSHLFLEELLNAIATLVLVVGTVVGGPLVGGVTDVLAGAALGGLVYVTDVDIKGESDNLVAVADASKNITTRTLSALNSLSLHLFSNYQAADNSSTNHTLAQIFNNGTWLDKRQIPILNSNTDLPMLSQTDIDTYAYNLLVATIVNQVWKAQNVYLMCFDMTEDTFNTLTGNAGTAANTIDSGLRIYYQGQGCWFQCASTKTVALQEHYYNIYPNGWDALGSQNYNFTTTDIMKGSIDAFALGGFNYRPTPSLLNTVLKEHNASVVDYGYPGVFSIPICRLSSAATAVTAAGFAAMLDAENDINTKPSWCYCHENADQNGVNITSVNSMGDHIADCGAVNVTDPCPGTKRDLEAWETEGLTEDEIADLIKKRGALCT